MQHPIFETMRFAILPFVICLILSSCSQTSEESVHGSLDGLVPLPAQMKTKASAATLLVNGLRWRWEISPKWAENKGFWQDWIPGQADSTGTPLRVIFSEKTPVGGYGLRVDSTKGIILHASDAEGVFRGLTTLRQILPVEAEQLGFKNDVLMPEVEIFDAPRFEHRGLLLDCCRHFMEPDFVKRMIDLLALHKMNVLHWHLTEDQGWRVPIEAYPSLTTVGAWRTEKDGSQHGGYYTKEEIRSIVAYAHQRHVTVIPEIELPGHSRAALAAYPWLSCTGDTLEVPNDWGVFKDIYCAGQDTTFRFLESVLDEVMELFPSRFIHIGGDEAPKVRWDACPKCQKRMKEEGLHDTHELQSWFINRIGRYLAAHGRQLIGWDEILEGGLPEGATVQSWRGMEGGMAAVNAGRDAIMSPTSHCYFDYPISATNMEEVYGFEPEPEGLKGTGRILGGECNMWTEHAPQSLVESKVFPRMVALAEVLWSPKNLRNWEGFSDRKILHDRRLDAWGVDAGLEAVPLEVSWNKGGDPFGVDVTLTRAIGHLEGTVQFVERSDLEPGDSRPLGSLMSLKGEGEIQAILNRHGRPLRDTLVFPVAGHVGAFSEVTIGHSISPYYPGGGMQGLADGRLGSLDFRDGCWQAIQSENMSITMQLPQRVMLDSLSVQLYRYQDAWIFLPADIYFGWSLDGEDWQGQTVSLGNILEPTDLQDIVRVSLPANAEAEWIRMEAVNPGPCPDWHDAASSLSWMFMDELVVHAQGIND